MDDESCTLLGNGIAVADLEGLVMRSSYTTHQRVGSLFIRYLSAPFCLKPTGTFHLRSQQFQLDDLLANHQSVFACTMELVSQI